MKSSYPFILTKNSSEEAMQNYVQYIAEVQDNKEPYPVDIEEVWRTAYTDKKEAIEALTSNYMEGEDYVEYYVYNPDRKHSKKQVIYRMTVERFEDLFVTENEKLWNAYCKIYNPQFNPLFEKEQSTLHI